LSEDECKALIAASEKAGFEFASFKTGVNEGSADVGYRDTNRFINDDKILAAYIYEKCAKLVPLAYEGFRLTSVNERFRFLKYDHPGSKFGKHIDGSFIKSDAECSLITLHIYLNEGFGGGETTFFDNMFKDSKLAIVPKTGLCLFFRQRGWIHEGSKMGEGVKYTIRSELMYTMAKIDEIQEYKHEICGFCCAKTQFAELECPHPFLLCKCAPLNDKSSKKFYCNYCYREFKGMPKYIEDKA